MPHTPARPTLALALALWFVPSTLPAEESSPQTSSELWQRTRDAASGWWEQSRDFAGQAARDAQRLLAPAEQDFGQIWEQVVPTLNDALILQERQRDLPETAWFGKDQRANRADIDALLDEAVDILSVSPALEYRERIQSRQEEIARARANIAEYRQQRISAPTESTLQKSVADYDKLIVARERDIERIGEEIKRLKDDFAQELRGIGLELTDEQLEFLLSTVVGDNLVDLGILFDNVKAISLQLEELVEQSGEDLQSARRYYGLHVVVLKSLDRMHARIEQAIAEQYLPQIDAIIAQAQTLAGDTRRLLDESPEQRDLLNGNLTAQQLTIQAAGVYRHYLEEQAKQVKKAREDLAKDIAAAWNTYETVRVSGELVGLVRSSQLLLDGLMSRQVPALRPFENLEMQREIQKLTQRLRDDKPR